MERKYFITIVDLKTLTQQNLIASEEEIDNKITKFLGGWDNLDKAGIFNNKEKDLRDFNAQLSGVTLDNKLMYSILVCLDQREN